MAFSYGEILLHRVWLPPHRLFLLQRRIEFISAREGNTKGSLDPEATGSFRQFGLLLPRPLQTGSGGDSLLSGSVVAVHSSSGFRGSLPQSRLIQELIFFLKNDGSERGKEDSFPCCTLLTPGGSSSEW